MCVCAPIVPLGFIGLLRRTQGLLFLPQDSTNPVLEGSCRQDGYQECATDSRPDPGVDDYAHSQCCDSQNSENVRDPVAGGSHPLSCRSPNNEGEVVGDPDNTDNEVNTLQVHGKSGRDEGAGGYEKEDSVT